MTEEEKQNALEANELEKAQAMIFYEEACQDVERWAAVVNNCENEQIELAKVKASGKVTLKTIVLIMVILINIIVIINLIVGCQTAQGVGRDITWMGAAGQEMLEHGHEYMEK